MAHANEREYLRQFLADWPVTGWPASLRAASVLEVGSAQYGYGIDYRALFPGLGFRGCDLKAGEGVDVVCDLTGDAHELAGEQFSAILCCSVLEHCTQPWTVAANLLNHLLPEGLLYVTIPWIWRYHAYPGDYWRMSVDGVKLLFPGVRWKRMTYATQKAGEFRRPDQPHDDGEPWRFINGERVYLVSQMVCMIGRKGA